MYSGFVVTRAGTFGVVTRRYTNEDGAALAIIRWGRLGWHTPVYCKDVHQLKSSYESEARLEAEAWLEEVSSEKS